MLSKSALTTIYAYTGAGEPLPGWPVTLTGLLGKFYWGGLAVGDIEFDGRDEVVVTGSQYAGNSYPFAIPIYLFNGDGSIRDGWPVVQPGPGGLRKPLIADLDGDFVCEIIGTSLHSVYSYRADGHFFATRALIGDGGVINRSALGDIDNDGALDLVVPSRQLHVYDLVNRYIRVSSGDSDYDTFDGVTIGDVDSDGLREIAAGTAFFQDHRYYALHLYNSKLQHLAGWPKDFELCLDNGFWPSTAMADLDRDSDMEIINLCQEQLHVWDQPNPAGGPVTVEWPMTGHDSGLSFNYHSGNPPEAMFTRGDGNGDGSTDLADVIAISTFLFQNAA